MAQGVEEAVVNNAPREIQTNEEVTTTTVSGGQRQLQSQVVNEPRVQTTYTFTKNDIQNIAVEGTKKAIANGEISIPSSTKLYKHRSTLKTEGNSNYTTIDYINDDGDAYTNVKGVADGIDKAIFPPYNAWIDSVPVNEFVYTKYRKNVTVVRGDTAKITDSLTISTTLLDSFYSDTVIEL